MSGKSQGILKLMTSGNPALVIVFKILPVVKPSDLVVPGSISA